MFDEPKLFWYTISVILFFGLLTSTFWGNLVGVFFVLFLLVTTLGIFFVIAAIAEVEDPIAEIIYRVRRNRISSLLGRLEL